MKALYAHITCLIAFVTWKHDTHILCVYSFCNMKALYTHIMCLIAFVTWKHYTHRLSV